MAAAPAVAPGTDSSGADPPEAGTSEEADTPSPDAALSVAAEAA